MPEPLPVDEVLPALLEGLAAHPAAILRGATGSGKTTRVPPALLDAGEGQVVVLEPRRIAARAAAARMAEERGVALGGEVGYRVRFDSRAGRDTRLWTCTEGILLRRLQEDPFLEGIGALVFDEFHERSLDGDLALALARRIQEEVRPDLRLVVLSATLEAGPLAHWLGGAPVLDAEGRTYPVEVVHLPAHGRERLEDHVERGLREALEHGGAGGDVLVFLPGVGEIRRCEERLAGLARARGRELAALYGELDPRRQDELLRPARGAPRIVLATNVAETSLTLPGVTAVVDSGLVRRLRYDPALGLDRLELGRIARASAEQRAGRAGRTAPGVCVRLWSPIEERQMVPAIEPEVRRLDLAGPYLQLAAFGERDPAAFPWFEAPRPESLERARELLERLGALDRGRVTEEGRALARLPLSPRLARLVLEGARHGVLAEAALVAALLADRDPFRGGRDEPPAERDADSDLVERVHAVERLEAGAASAAPLPTPGRGALRALLRVRDQTVRLVERVLEPGQRDLPRDDALRLALLRAFPDRLARRRAPGSDRAVMVGGKGVQLAPTSAVRGAELLVVLDLDAGRGGDARARLASAVEREWLDPARQEEAVEAWYDPGRERVLGRRVVRHDGLVLEEREHPAPDDGLLLAEVARADLTRALPADDRDLHAWIERVRCLADWRPELGLPVPDEALLGEIAAELAPGRRSLAELRSAPWLEHLRARLDHAQQVALEREAPERLPVPSGSHLRLAYERGRPPVLAARIQELFGLAETPRIAGGRVPVLLHLLAPSGRPQQVTDDLASFWNTTYAVVRKELRARYPRHAWPEDPWNAQAERRPRRRG